MRRLFSSAISIRRSDISFECSVTRDGSFSLYPLFRDPIQFSNTSFSTSFALGPVLVLTPVMHPLSFIPFRERL